MPGPARGVLREEPSASIAHARVCEGRGRRCYGHPYSGTKPETADTRQGEAYGCDRSSPTRKNYANYPPQKDRGLARGGRVDVFRRLESAVSMNPLSACA